jgi:hypothetical protein
LDLAAEILRRVAGDSAGPPTMVRLGKPPTGHQQVQLAAARLLGSPFVIMPARCESVSEWGPAVRECRSSSGMQTTADRSNKLSPRYLGRAGLRGDHGGEVQAEAQGVRPGPDESSPQDGRACLGAAEGSSIRKGPTAGQKTPTDSIWRQPLTDWRISVKSHVWPTVSHCGQYALSYTFPGSLFGAPAGALYLRWVVRL